MVEVRQGALGVDDRGSGPAGGQGGGGGRGGGGDEATDIKI